MFEPYLNLVNQSLWNNIRYLKVELNDPIYGKKYRVIYEALEDILSISASRPSEEPQMSALYALGKAFPISPTTVTIMETLMAQDKYFSGEFSIVTITIRIIFLSILGIFNT